jgi:hypothetical protein
MLRSFQSARVPSLVRGVGIAACLASCAAPLAAAPLFESSFRTFDAGAGARFIAIADVTHDGHPDCIVANGGASTLSVLAGRADGSLGDAVPYAAGPNGTEVLQVADVNGDGRVDVVYTDGVYSDAYSSVGVMLGGADGGLTRLATYATGRGAQWLTLADMNGDGHLDAVTASADPFYEHCVSILPGDGLGHFGTRQVVDFGVGVPLSCVVTGDLNGDGRPDLVTISPNGTVASVRLQLAGGSFGAQAAFPISSRPSAATLADVDGDGHLDIVAGGDQVGVLYGLGDGTFAPRRLLDTGGGQPIVADVNRDGIADIACTSGSLVAVFLGLGGRVFSPVRTSPTGFTAVSIALGDLNGDGIPDLATANDYSKTVAVLLGNGDGSFGRGRDYGVGTTPTWVDAGDLDGDGHPDLAVANHGTGSISVFAGDGHAGFTSTATLPASNPTALVIHDVDGDGLADLVVAGQGLMARRALGGMTFAPPVVYDDSLYLAGLAVGDLNGDGLPDLATVWPGRQGDPHQVPSWISGTIAIVRYGAGDGTFPARDTLTVGSHPTDVAIADLDGNGRNDLVVATPGSGSISVLLADALGRLSTAVQYPASGGVSSIAVADLDGDGLLDVVGAGGEGAGSVEILRGAPGGTLGPPTVIGSFLGVVSVSARDLDLDGHVDLVVSPGYSNGATILRGLGNGTFGPPEVYGTGVGPYHVAIRDLSSDGVPEIAVPNAYSQTVSVLLNLTASSPPLDVPPSGGRVARLDLAVSPNPIHEVATLSVRLVSAMGARLEVLDITGRRVWERPLDALGPGAYEVRWTRGAVAPGIYLVRLIQRDASVARRVAVVR